MGKKIQHKGPARQYKPEQQEKILTLHYADRVFLPETKTERDLTEKLNENVNSICSSTGEKNKFCAAD